MSMKLTEEQFDLLLKVGSVLLLSHLPKSGPLTASILFGAYRAISCEMHNHLYKSEFKSGIMGLRSFTNAALITDLLSFGNRIDDAGIFGAATSLIAVLHASYYNANLPSKKDILTDCLSSISCALLFNAARDTGLFTAANVAFRSTTGINAPMLAESICFVFALPKVHTEINKICNDLIPKF